MAISPRPRASLVFLVAFGFLTSLMALLGYGAFRVAEGTHREVSAVHEAHRRAAKALGEIQSLMYQSAVLLRDLALDPGPEADSGSGEEFRRLRSQVEARLAVLDRHFGRGHLGVLAGLREELDKYWRIQEPVFAGVPGSDAARGAARLRWEVVPLRRAALVVADEIALLNQADLAREAERVQVSLDRSRWLLGGVFTVALSLALAASALAAARVFRLERGSEDERTRAEGAEQELRRLSAQLVRAQEEERRALSRELHDEVGQNLTGLRLVLGRLERLRAGPEEPFRAHLDEARSLAESGLRAVRDLAMGLRPAMLDDLGLGPALHWQAREFSRRTGVPVNVECGPDLDGLPDPVRTCLYRVTQEALTNCARHAGAHTVSAAARREPGGVSLAIEDDGVGFDPAAARGRGLGLLGIEERVRELGGAVALESRPRRGTRLRVTIPLPPEEPP